MNSKDTESIVRAYKIISEMNLGPAGTGIQPVGNPVILSIPIADASGDDPTLDVSPLSNISELVDKIQQYNSEQGTIPWIDQYISKAECLLQAVYSWISSNTAGEDKNMYGVGVADTINTTQNDQF